jgi:hypothetical protein
MSMAKFRKKPVVIEAVEWTGEQEAVNGLVALMAGKDDAILFCDDGSLEIPTLEGDMRAETGDWIIKGVKGELYPCKPDVFAATYEPA